MTKACRASDLHGHGFPNCFFMGFTQSGFTTSVPHTLNEQSKHTAYILRHVVDHGIRSFEATQEAEDRWVGIIKSKAHWARASMPNARPAITTTTAWGVTIRAF